MEIKDFVKNVLLDIINAVDAARKETGYQIELYGNPTNRHVDFDIAVSVEEGQSKAGKAGIKVMHFVEAGGNLSMESKNSTVSRIKFGIYVDNCLKNKK